MEEVFVGLTKITDENRDALTDLALSMYVGEYCRTCGRNFISLKVLREANPVCIGTKPLRLACKKCYKK